MKLGANRGVIFDTNCGDDVSLLEAMVEKRRISARGGQRAALLGIGKGDIVFYAFVGLGLIAAAKVTGDRVEEEGDESYWSVEFLTPVPTDFDMLPIMNFDKVAKVTGKPFASPWDESVAWLDGDATQLLLRELRIELDPATVKRDRRFRR